VNLPDRLKWIGISSLWAYRVLTWAVLVLGFSFAAVVLGLRYWVLPNIENYREDIARVMSERMRLKVTIDRIHANWDGLRPQLKLENVTVYDNAGRPALELQRVDNTLSWLTLLTFELRFHAADIYRPTLNVRRDARGMISVAGIELSPGKDGGGSADWALRQRDIEVHDATILWTDELRGAPQLELRHVSLQLYNQGRRHRFGLHATPPGDLAAPLDLRGDLTGDSVKALSDWNGKFFVQLDYADIAAWRTWLPFPVEFPRGAGALRAWLTFSHDRLVEAVADVRLANVLTRLGADLPQLDLTDLSGRIAWKQSDKVFEISTTHLGLMTTSGLSLEPADFLLRVTQGSGRTPARGEMRASALDLGTLAMLADRLPFGEEARKQLAEYGPKGGIYEMAAHWTGEWREPKEYGVRGRFRDLSLHHSGKIPGFTGVSGSVDATERGGTLVLNSSNATVSMPLVFRDALDFEALAAQVSWSRSGGNAELRLNSISFSNTHLAGTLFGNYRTAGSTRGTIDITGNLTRADARYASRYIPLVVGKNAREWLDTAFLSGQSNDVSLRLKGNLDEFPFPDGHGGVFQVAAKVTGGTLNYASGWPNIENISGDLLFRGKRMDVYARQGSILSVRLPKVHVEIPDLLPVEKTLNVEGEAEGPTADFFAFIEKSPVGGMIDHFTGGWQAQGNGKLALKLSIPLHATSRSKVAGTYQFSGNSVTILPDLPAIEQAGGRVSFTESSVRAQNIAGSLLGGPVTISATSASDSSVRVNASGRINADNARRSAGNPYWAQSLRGTADWRAVITARKRNADVVVESSLQGLAADFPAPLSKTAAESLPFRFERHLLPAGQDRLSVAFGDVVSMNLVRRVDGTRATIARGNVRFGGPAGEPDRPGVWVSGTVKALDVDRWQALLKQAGGSDAAIEWAGVDLKAETLDVMGRRFTEFATNATAQGGQWRGTVTGKGIDGTVSWQAQGQGPGKLTARMKMLTVPPATPAGTDAPTAVQQASKDRDLPAVDLTAEQFVNKGKMLGRLELAALPEGRDWRITQLRISNPESTLTVDGLWQMGIAQPRTQLNLRLEASDVGKLLLRLGYPEGVRRGTARLEGALSWAGAPQDFDYPSLSGNLVVQAARGQFVKLEPGIGKLLGILSLQSLPRRITLDFRDIFSEGFAFDEIVGSVKISRGNATLDNLRIQGPAARVLMSGDVDLAQETQKLRVRISPHISDTVSLVGALAGGPVAGVAAFLAQKVLKDPIDQMVSYEYDVTGKWAEPTVKRVGLPMSEAEQAPQ
jgi:uncharacterized protein (TIGR02099 family)